MPTQRATDPREHIQRYRSDVMGNAAWEDWLANRRRQADLAPWADRLDRRQAEDAYYDYTTGRRRQQEGYNRTHSGYYQMDFDPANPYGQTYQGPGGRKVELNDRTRDRYEKGTWDADPFKDFINKDRRIHSIMMGGSPILSKDVSGNVKFGNIAGMMGGGGAAGLGGSALAGYGGGGGAPAWAYEGPEAWGGYEFDRVAIDPREAMKAQVPWFKEQLGDALAQVTADSASAMRGFTGDSSYMGRMSNEGRRWNEDFQRIVQEMDLQAQTANARNQLEADIAKQNADLQAWATKGGWGHESQMAQNQYQGDMYNAEQARELERRLGLDRFALGKAGLEQDAGSQYANIIGALAGFLG